MTNEELIEKARAGNTEAFNQFFEKNERFAYYIARKFGNTGVDVEDLASLAKVGMMKAYHSFDTAKAFKFATYAARCMENEILMYLRKQKKQVGDVSLDFALNTDVDGHELTLADVLEDTSMPAPDSVVMSEALVKVTEEFLQTLSERDQYIFLSCVVHDYNQHDVAERLNISQSYISRLERKLINQFRRHASRVGFIDGQEKAVILKKREVVERFVSGDEAIKEEGSVEMQEWHCAECGSMEKPAGAGSNTTLCKSCRSEKLRQGKKTYEITCTECGREFTAKSKMAKYCVECKQSGKVEVDVVQAKQVPVYVHLDGEGDGKVEHVQLTVGETETNLYSLSQVAGLLDVSTSALRKWCLGLEKQGYVFENNSEAGRFMNNHDIFILRQIQKRMGKGSSIEEVVADVLNRYSKHEKEKQQMVLHRLLRGETIYLSSPDARKICEALDVLGVYYAEEKVTAITVL